MLTVKELMDELQRLLEAGEVKNDTPVMTFNGYWYEHQKLTSVGLDKIDSYVDGGGMELYTTKPTVIISLWGEGDK